MKRIPVSRWAAALLLLLALPRPGGAQVTLGVSAGMGFATLEGDDAGDPGRSDGLMGGAFLAFPVSDVFSVAPGLYYVQKGAEETDGLVEEEVELDYLEVPVLGVFSLTGAGRPLGVSVFLGPSVAFELSCKFETEVGEDELGASTDCDDDPDGERRKVDIGAIFGAGVSFPLSGSVGLLLNGGLDMGLRSIDDSPTELDIKNSMWFVTAGVAFPLGG